MSGSFRDRYPAPWEIIESGESVRVVARDGTVLAHVYFEDQPTRRAITNRVTLVEARAFAKAIAGLACDSKDSPSMKS